MRFLEAAATNLAAYDLEKKEAGTDLTWDDERGWNLVVGQQGPTPKHFKDFVQGGYRGNSVVRACVHEVQTSISEAPIRAFREVPETIDDTERVPGHPAEELFFAPNSRDPGLTLIERAVQHFLLGGNFFWEKVRTGAGFVDELLPITPHRVEGARVDKNGIPQLFHVRNSEGIGSRVIKAEDMVHVPDADPLNEVFGMPRLLAAALDIASDTDASKYVSEVLRNHGSPGLIVGTKVEGAREEQLERAEQRFEDKFGPGRGRGKVAFIPGAESVKEIGFNLQELEFPNLRSITREGICAVIGIDPIMIGFGSAARGGTLGGAEHKEARRKLWEQTLIPLIRRFEAYMNFWLAPDFGDVILKFDLTLINALRDDRDAAQDRATSMKDAGVYTPQEIRAETAHNPEPPEGAVFVQPLGIRTVPAADVLSGTGQAAPALPTSGDDDDDDDDDDKTDLASHRARRRKRARRKASAPRTQYVAWEGMTVADKRDCWKAFDVFARYEEPLYAEAARILLFDEAIRVEGLATSMLQDKSVTEDSLSAFYKGLGEFYDDYHDRWFNEFLAATTHTTELVGAQVAADLGMAFDVFNPGIQSFIKERATLMVDVPKRTQRAIIQSIADGNIAGESAAALRGRVESLFADGFYKGSIKIPPTHARVAMIARTESTAVSNGGALWTQRASGLLVDKEWATQGDDRVRDDHIDMEGETVPSEELFSNGLDYPQEPNCRCGMLFNIRRIRPTRR